ncbi:MAG: type II secretion system protein GspM [Pseudomonadota bacterium]
MKRLKSRERIVVAGGLTLLILFFVYHFAISPARDRLKLLERLAPAKERELEQIIHLKEEYEDLKLKENQSARGIGKEGKSTVTLSYLEGLAERSGLKNNIEYMKPLGESRSGRYLRNSVEIKLSNVSMGQLSRFLYDIEGGERPLNVTALDILTNRRDSSYVDAKVQITSFALA